MVQYSRYYPLVRTNKSYWEDIMQQAISNAALYTTQGGGICEWVGEGVYEQLVWITPPEGFGWKPGDLVPVEWSYTDTNWDPDKCAEFRSRATAVTAEAV